MEWLAVSVLAVFIGGLMIVVLDFAAHDRKYRSSKDG